MNGLEHVAVVAAVTAAALITVVVWFAVATLQDVLRRFEFEDDTDDDQGATQ